MAADVGTLVRILNGYLDEQRSESDAVTKDLFGCSPSSCSTSRIIGSKDIDLDLQAPSGWEKCLDLKSGKVYLQRSNSPISSSSTATSTGKQVQEIQEVQDLNFPPPPPPCTTSTIEDDGIALDLKLVPCYDYRSVCTLDKVKSALERVKKRPSPSPSPSPVATISVDSSSEEEEVGRISSSSSSKKSLNSSSGLLFAGGCPSCLMYVMISKTNPKCPRCDSIVPISSMCGASSKKKPKLNLDLNLNLVSSSW